MDAVSAVMQTTNPVLIQIAAMQSAMQNQARAAAEAAKSSGTTPSNGGPVAPGRIDTYA